MLTVMFIVFLPRKALKNNINEGQQATKINVTQSPIIW